MPERLFTIYGQSEIQLVKLLAMLRRKLQILGFFPIVFLKEPLGVREISNTPPPPPAAVGSSCHSHPTANPREVLENSPERLLLLFILVSLFRQHLQ